MVVVSLLICMKSFTNPHEYLSNIQLEFLVIICILLKTTKEIKLGLFFGTMKFPNFQGFLYQLSIMPIVKCKNKIAMVISMG